MSTLASLRPHIDFNIEEIDQRRLRFLNNPRPPRIPSRWYVHNLFICDLDMKASEKGDVGREEGGVDFEQISTSKTRPRSYHATRITPRVSIQSWQQLWTSSTAWPLIADRWDENWLNGAKGNISSRWRSQQLLTHLSSQVNVPKTRRTYCKGKDCRKHTQHKVTQYKAGKVHYNVRLDLESYLTEVA